VVDQRFAVSVHVMLSLAQAHSQNSGPGRALVTSEYLAESVRTNPAVIRRIVSRLAQSQLVNSFRGKAGGVELAKEPSAISLADIYSAISEKSLLNHSDKAPKRQCKVSCSMSKIMGGLIEGFEKNSLRYFSRIYLSDLLAEVHKN